MSFKDFFDDRNAFHVIHKGHGMEYSQTYEVCQGEKEVACDESTQEKAEALIFR